MVSISYVPQENRLGMSHSEASDSATLSCRPQRNPWRAHVAISEHDKFVDLRKLGMLFAFEGDLLILLVLEVSGEESGAFRGVRMQKIKRGLTSFRIV